MSPKRVAPTRAAVVAAPTVSAPLPDQLVVLLNGDIAGILTRDPLRFTYDDTWRRRRDAYALSLALPLAAREYGGREVLYYLRGLLADNPTRLARIAAQYGVSPGDPFALLAHIGEDCPGAVQFARPERLDRLRSAGAEDITWLTTRQVAEILRGLVSDTSPFAVPEEAGHFSLPGALAKVALRWDATKRRWGRPSGRAATTHILKPPRAGIPFHAENEHLSLELARELGFSAAHTEVRRFEDQVTLVVSRYDREHVDGVVRRIHQEDMSQALGADPDLKYAAQGAPTLAQMIDVLRQWSAAPVEESLGLVAAAAFNWAIAGTDAHPRNYSVLIRAGTQVTLAPLYDIASALLLTRRRPPIDPEDMQLAMTIGDRARIGGVDRAAWEREAKLDGLRPARVVERVTELLEQLPRAVELVAARAIAGGMDQQFVTRYVREIRRHSVQRLAALQRK
jgi:serine/threonine-protein kinase HipA